MDANEYELPGYVYIGDVNILYGGKFINVGIDEMDETIVKRSHRYDTGHIIEVISTADSGWKYTLIDSGYVYLGRKLSDWRNAIKTCGWLPSALHGASRERRRALLIEAMDGYYGHDSSNGRRVYEDVDGEEEKVWQEVEALAI